MCQVLREVPLFEQAKIVFLKGAGGIATKAPAASNAVASNKKAWIDVGGPAHPLAGDATASMTVRMPASIVRARGEGGRDMAPCYWAPATSAV